jgi:hypothetical protein
VGPVDDVVYYRVSAPTTVTMSGDGERLYVTSADERLRVFDVGDRSPRAEAEVVGRWAYPAAAPDGRVVVLDAEGIAQLDGKSLEPLRPTIDATRKWPRLALDAVGSRAAYLDGDARALEIADLDRGEVTGRVTLPDDVTSVIQTSRVVHLAFVGSRVAVGLGDGRVLLVDPESARVVRSATVVDARIDDLLPSNGMLVVAGGDGTMVLLDADTLRERARFRPVPELEVPAPPFPKPQGTVLAVRDDGTFITAIGPAVATFDARTERLLARACAIAGPDLSASQWRALLPDRDPVPPCRG